MKETGLGRRRWVSVMDEMWPLFAADPPDELMVQVLDTDETRKAREYGLCPLLRGIYACGTARGC